MFPDSASEGRLTALRERQLIERAQRGCAESAHALITTYQDRLHAFVWRLVRNRADSEEICQDAFLRAFSSLKSFDFTYRFSTWLFTIGYRLSLNSLRKRKNSSAEIDFSTFADGADPADNVGEAVANTEEAKRLKKTIWESVDRLTPPQRATVLLFYRESMSCQEIGEVLDIPAATVKSHLHRARARLKEMLEDRIGEDWTTLRFGVAGGSA
jgi:RNA polymerase sigma-70 factor (ECF subfamily)